MDNKMRLHKIALGERTEETVRIYFEKAKQPEIRLLRLIVFRGKLYENRIGFL
jgi:hypothetical protein